MRMLIALALSLAALAAEARAHDIHSSVTDIIYDARAATASITVRLFADDLASAVGSHDPKAVHAYVASTLQLADERGRRLALEWVGATRTGEFVVVTLRGRAAGGLAAVTVRNTILVDRFKDQVNIVRATFGGRRPTALFTRGDGAKRLH